MNKSSKVGIFQGMFLNVYHCIVKRTYIRQKHVWSLHLVMEMEQPIPNFLKWDAFLFFDDGFTLGFTSNK